MNRISKVMLISFMINTVLSISKIAFGFLSKSQALLADGVHSFSDLSTDLVAIVGNKLANKEPDFKHPYGHGKFEYLTSLLIGGIILSLGIGLIYNSFNSSTNSISSIVIIVSIFTIFSKFLLARYICKKGKEYKNNILIASGKESNTDVVGSVVVLLSAIFVYFSKYFEIFIYADQIASIIVGLFIVKTGFSVLKDNMSTILDEQETDGEYMKNVKEIINKSLSVKNIDSLVLLKMGKYYKLISDVSMDPNISILEAHNELDKIEKALEEFDEKIKYKTIHINPYKEG